MRNYRFQYLMLAHFFCLSLFCSLNVSAQESEFLTANNIKAGIGIGGNLFSRLNDSVPYNANDQINKWGLFEAPKGSGVLTQYTSALWICAYDSTSLLHVTAQRYKQHGGDYYDGPIAANYTAQYDNYYKQVFKVTQQQIQHHLTLAFPVSTAQVDTALLKWPGKGNPYVTAKHGINITGRLAPFVDVDSNGIYDATKGDYPAFCGSEAIFFVFNDTRGYPYETGINVLGLEVRGLVQVFGSNTTPAEKSAINNTVFVSYEIENKSHRNYHNMFVGKFEDPDLGCADDDRVGCDPSKNLMFAYNGNMPDGANCNGVTGYGDMRTCYGVKFLNHTMRSFTYLGDTYATSDPLYGTSYANYLVGIWNDGTPRTYGGTGYRNTPGGTVTKFVFPSDPNDISGWSDATSGMVAGNRRMVATADTTSFFAGDIKHYDFAYIFSYDVTGTNLTIVDTLKRDADIVQQFYDNQFAPCPNVFVLTDIQPVNAEPDVTVFPNPANNQVNISTKSNLENVGLYDLQGRLLISKKCNEKATAVNVAAMAKGVYLLKMEVEGRVVLKKLVIQ